MDRKIIEFLAYGIAVVRSRFLYREANQRAFEYPGINSTTVATPLAASLFRKAG